MTASEFPKVFKSIPAPAGVAQLVGLPSHTPKGCGFNPCWSVYGRQPSDVSLPLPSPLSKNNKQFFNKNFFLNRGIPALSTGWEESVIIPMGIYY